MVDQKNNETEDMLNRKLKQLEHQYGESQQMIWLSLE